MNSSTEYMKEPILRLSPAHQALLFAVVTLLAVGAIAIGISFYAWKMRTVFAKSDASTISVSTVGRFHWLLHEHCRVRGMRVSYHGSVVSGEVRGITVPYKERDTLRWSVSAPGRHEARYVVVLSLRPLWDNSQSIHINGDYYYVSMEGVRGESIAPVGRIGSERVLEFLSGIERQE